MSRNEYIDDRDEPPTDAADAVLAAREPICQRLEANGWRMWLDASYVTVYVKRDWACSVPYTETITPTFRRDVRLRGVTA